MSGCLPVDTTNPLKTTKNKLRKQKTRKENKQKKELKKPKLKFSHGLELKTLPGLCARHLPWTDLPI